MGVNKLENITHFNAFGQKFDFRVHKSSPNYKSVVGFCLTITMLVCLGAFAYVKYQTLIGYNDSNILITNHQNFFDQDF